MSHVSYALIKYKSHGSEEVPSSLSLEFGLVFTFNQNIAYDQVPLSQKTNHLSNSVHNTSGKITSQLENCDSQM